MAKSIRTILRNVEITVELCHDQYIWIGNRDGYTYNPLIIHTRAQLKKLGRVVNKLLRSKHYRKK